MVIWLLDLFLTEPLTDGRLLYAKDVHNALRLLFRAALNFQTWFLYLVALLVKDGEVSLLQPAGIWKPNEHGFVHFAARIFSSMMGT